MALLPEPQCHALGGPRPPEPRAASSERSLPVCCPVRPHRGPGKARGSVPQLGRWLEVARDSGTCTKCTGSGASQMWGRVSGKVGG